MLKFTQSELYNQLTIVVVAHNLVKLCYPFVESFWSAIPLGCRFLIGDFDNTDNTMNIYSQLSKYAPIDVVKLPWRSGHGLTTIGIATHDLIQHSNTPMIYNLQACEILCDDAISSIFNLNKNCGSLQDGVMSFRHFWGHLHFDGAIGGHGYGQAKRLMPKTSILNHSDGCNPVDCGGHMLGYVNRYAYCFDNQAAMKIANHAAEFGNDKKQQTSSIQWCKTQFNHISGHPQCVTHLIDRNEYDINISLNEFKNNIQQL